MGIKLHDFSEQWLQGLVPDRHIDLKMYHPKCSLGMHIMILYNVNVESTVSYHFKNMRQTIIETQKKFKKKFPKEFYKKF